MTDSVSMKRSALKTLERIGRDDRLRLVAAIDRLRTNPSAGSRSATSEKRVTCLMTELRRDRTKTSL